jgi:uncharacterized protein
MAPSLLHRRLIRQAQPPGSADCCAIAVIAKASSPGNSKSRLAPPLTFEQAADLNTAFVRDSAGNVSRAAALANIACYLAFGPPSAVTFFEQLVPGGVGLIEAWLPKFGDSLFETAETLLDLGYGAGCLLNSDSPTLPTAVLTEAAEVLQRPGERIVIGPSLDGGYYLLGMKRPYRRLFEDIEWSTPRVLRQTLERAEELQLETVTLPIWYDVDDARSLRLLARETLLSVQFSDAIRSYEAPHTSAFLTRHWGTDALLDLTQLPETPTVPLPNEFGS